ncbi:MAG: Thiol-disulfide oxidoreductase ResA [Rhodothermaeota bacterium MED-G12]|nr:MAG: Thiol-disulfide oxidoreductase ResA [Rhodothermaeota bacterium MED-G12]|tara:strand:+ start:2433 stop:3125 length:693 start_codon:yes stop_codon:yes gene_type:complete
MRMKEKSTSTKRTWRRELSEWGIIIAIGLILYIGGWHTEVIGFAQRILLNTHIIQPKIADANIQNYDDLAANFEQADYNFYLSDELGAPVSLADFKGKTIFMNYWATWCPPCIAEMPNIQALYEDMTRTAETKEQVVFMMVSLDEDPKKALAFIERKGYSMPVYFPRSRKPLIYDTSVVPTTYVINSDGYIVMKKRGMAQYNSQRFKDFLRNASDYSMDPESLLDKKAVH